MKTKSGYYIAGFVDGEGSFNVSVKKRKDYQGKWKITASFNISQRDKKIFLWIQKILGCGTLRARKDGVIYYEVTNINDLNKKIIPFFQNFQFVSENKKKNFLIFTQIVCMMKQKQHLNRNTLKRILELREKLNEGHGRKRKYNIHDVMDNKESPETKRKTLKSHWNADRFLRDDIVRSYRRL